MTTTMDRLSAKTDTNNVRQVLLNIPDHPGREGVGRLKNEKALTYEPLEHDQ